ncbi:DoxX family protein [Azoarcus sp. KH32C]|uniref:DoxX family protein n=1 Tax=Azoarcus sp. KH32C TaxID=748247 RepID=UPI000238619D|nr:DoxX family protein [Azoarcus sp. KH32C]BAL25688.1 DoxD family protein [Azoarcus sp. KH32C]
MKDTATLAVRLMLALMFLIAGWGKLGAGYAGTQQYMASAGLPGMLLPLVIFAELGGGLAVVIGLFTRLAALGLALFTVLAALFFHTNFADPMQSIMFMKNIAIAGGLLLLAVHGPGSYSIDATLRHRT